MRRAFHGRATEPALVEAVVLPFPTALAATAPAKPILDLAGHEADPFDRAVAALRRLAGRLLARAPWRARNA